MQKKYQPIWELAVPYLKNGLMKDFILHTEQVVKSMEILIEKEGGDPDTLIPAAILHDVGFSKVSKELQTNAELPKKREAQRQHLLFAKEIIEEILTKVGYKKKDIATINAIVVAHKFHHPRRLDKQLLVDADNLSDVWKISFDADVISYHSTPAEIYEFRTRNKYYTKTANQIATTEMAKRLEEINKK